MNLYDYQNMYKKMEMPKEMDERIRERMTGELNRKKVMRSNGYRFGFAVAAAFALIVCVTQFDTIVAAAEKMARFIRYTFVVNDDSGNAVDVDMTGVFVTLLEDAPKDLCYMDSVKAAGESMGITLLDTEQAYLYEGCVEYTPYLTKDEELYGVMLSDKLYSVGDLQDVTLHRKGEDGGIDWMEYNQGVNYQTPISVQITIHTDKDMTGEYENNEIGYVSKSQKIDLTADDAGTFEAEVYEAGNLGVKVVLYSVHTDGPMSWNIEDGSVKCCVAVFVYEGVEYVYMGGVNHETMKMFLDTLG